MSEDRSAGKKMKCRFISSVGFTLIELLVVLAIGMMVMSVGLAAYNNFDAKQKVVAGGRNLLLDLRDAQKRAQSGDKPSDCDTLLGWRVTGSEGENGYGEEAVCAGGAAGLVERTMVPGAQLGVGGVDVEFAVISGEVTGSGVVTVTDEDGNYEYGIEVTTAGGVSDLGFAWNQ